jgi:hypothetical protein
VPLANCAFPPMRWSSMLFEKEEALVERFVSLLREGNYWNARHISCEFDYRRGRTDVVAVTDDDRIVAFEAKLTRWRQALHQAQRNRCFAHETYVLLPRGTALRAFRYREEFTKRHVGLCYLEDGELVVLQLAEANSPIEPWLTEQAGAFAKSTSITGLRGRCPGHLR